MAVCNFSPDDRSRIVKDWIVDWPLICRTDGQLRELFAPDLTPAVTRSPDGGLLYASAVCPVVPSVR